MSIPHTGTQFVIEYLETIPLVFTTPSITFIQHPSKSVLYNTHIGSYADKNHYPGEGEVMEYAKENCKVVIPLRPPIENAITYISRYNNLAACANNWNILIDYIIPRYDIFWFDINIEKQNRHNMINKLNEFIGISNDGFGKYANDWKPVNQTGSTPIKEAYYSQNKLPEGYDFECFDYATDWYNNKNTELNKLYAN